MPKYFQFPPSPSRFLASAKDGTNVAATFQCVAERAMERVSASLGGRICSLPEEMNTIWLNATSKGDQSGCYCLLKNTC